MTFNRVVVSVSGGAGSALAYLRCLDKYGPERVVGLFADTNTEDDDLYRFLGDLERVTNTKLVRLNDGRDIWDVFHQHRFLVHRGTGSCKASVELKRKPLDAWHKANMDPAVDVIASGMSWMEPERQSRMNRATLPFTVIHPLNWSPRLSWCQEKAALADHGLQPPRLYAMGYEHNNCGGGCVVGGIKQWSGLYHDFPERFARAEREEAKLFAEIGHPINRDRRGGESKPLLLSEIRRRVDAGEQLPDDFRTACNCMGYATQTSDAPLFGGNT